MLQGLRKVPHEYSHLVLNPANPNLVEMLGNSKGCVRKRSFGVMQGYSPDEERWVNFYARESTGILHERIYIFSPSGNI